MPEEAEPQIENEDAALKEAYETIEDALMVVCGPEAKITGLEMLDNALKKMIRKIAGNVSGALAQAVNASKEEEDEGDEEQDTEQAIDDFAKEPKEPSAGDGEKAPDDLQNEMNGDNKKQQTPSDKNAASTPQPAGKEDRDGKGDEENKDRGDKETPARDASGPSRDAGGGNNEDKKNNDSKQPQKEEGQQQTPERPTNEQTPAAGQPENQEQPAQENTGQGQQPEEQQEQAEEKKPFERGEKGGITQSINVLRNSGEIKKIDEQIKVIEKQRNPLNSSKRKLQASLIPLEVAEKSLVASILILRAIQIAIYIIAILSAITIVLFVLGVSEIIWGAGLSMNLLITSIKLAKDKLKKIIKKIKGQISEIDKKMANLNKNLQKLAGQKRNIINRSLIENSEKQRQEEQNQQDLET